MSQRAFKEAFRLSALYAVIAGLWILFSDTVAAWFVSDPRMLTQIQSVKGIIFVTVTALLLFLETRRVVGNLRKSEAEVRQLNEELERRVAERTAQLEDANRELEAFAHSVSHDLRAPLHAMGGYAELLEGSLGEHVDEEGKECIQTIKDQVVRMSKLIDGLLDFSRTSRVALNKTTVSLGLLFKEVSTEMTRTNPKRAIDWHIDTLPDVEADAYLLRLVVVNLLSNAVKYTGQRDKAVIKIGEKEDPREHIIFVQDNGAGFDPKYQDKLFGVFQRLHSSSQFEGTGIGLANVRRIIHRHGGRTWAEGQVNQGATFYFSLPKSSDIPTA